MYEVLKSLSFKNALNMCLRDWYLNSQNICPVSTPNRFWYCSDCHMWLLPSMLACSIPELQWLWVMCPQCWSSQQLWALWQVMLELKAMWHSLVHSVLPHCSHWKKDLKEAYKFCQITFWQILEVISLGISCCFVKLKWYCHVVTRQCCEKNHKRVWSIQIP